MRLMVGGTMLQQTTSFNLATGRDIRGPHPAGDVSTEREGKCQAVHYRPNIYMLMLSPVYLFSPSTQLHYLTTAPHLPPSLVTKFDIQSWPSQDSLMPSALHRRDSPLSGSRKATGLLMRHKAPLSGLRPAFRYSKTRLTHWYVIQFELSITAALDLERLCGGQPHEGFSLQAHTGL